MGVKLCKNVWSSFQKIKNSMYDIIYEALIFVQKMMNKQAAAPRGTCRTDYVWGFSTNVSHFQS
jgi:hypothetical protein